MSSRKSNTLAFKVLSSVSMSATITSSATNIQYLDNIGVQHNWSGSPVGTLTVQISADYSEGPAGSIINTGNWITLTQPDGSSFLVNTGGATGQAYMDITQTSAPWIRSVFTSSSGTGFLSTFITAKMV